MVRKVNRPAALLALAILSGLALRATRLAFQPLWWDEGYSAWFATHSLAQLTQLTAEDIHPPLYYALLHGWTRLVGPGPVNLRLLSVIFGVLAIPVMYGAARRILGSQRPAAIAVLLLAINPLHVYYSQEVRMYGLVALLSAGILWAAWEVMSEDAGALRPGSLRELRSGRLIPALAYIALVTLALYTQYYAVFLPVGLTLYALSHWRRDLRALVRWFALQFIAALLYLPWVIYAAPRLTLYVSQKVVQDADRPLGPLAYLGRHLSAYTVGHLEGPLAPWWPLALVLLLPITAGLVAALRARRGSPFRGRSLVGRSTMAGRNSAAAAPVPFLLTVLATALILGWLIGLRYPFFPDRGERLLLLALPPFVMLVAAGVDGLVARGRRWAAYGTVAALVLASVASLGAFYTVPRYPEDDYRPLIARTIEQGLPEDTVFAVYPWQVGYWRSYAAGVDGPTAVLAPTVAWGPQLKTALDDALSRGRVWFPAHLSLGGLLETEVERYLSETAGAYSFANTWYGAGTRLSAWFHTDRIERPAEVPTTGKGQYDGPGGEFSVGAETPWQAPLPAANAVFPLILNWSWEGPVAPDVAVSVRLVDDLGQIWGQNDYEPAGRLAGSTVAQNGEGGWGAVDRPGLLIPAGTPPGRYSVQLVVSTQDGATLPARVGDKSLQSLPLVPLDVAPADRQLGSERLPIAIRSTTDLQDGLRFLGYSIDDAPLTPGVSRPINLFWQATGGPAADYTAFAQVLGPDGAPVAGWEAPPGAAYPTSQWAPGTLIRTQAAIRLPAGTPDGRYPVIAGLYDPADGKRLKTARGAEQVSLGNVTVQGRRHEMNAPATENPADVTFGGIARLVGYDDAINSATGAIAVTLCWQALGASDRPLTVFAHLQNAQGDVIGYGDGEPGNGEFPTTGWLAGEYLDDAHRITFLPAAAEGGLRLAIGLYDPATGERLLTSDGKDEFIVELAAP